MVLHKLHLEIMNDITLSISISVFSAGLAVIRVYEPMKNQTEHLAP
jgi:hypothetical protein